ncbi:MAG: hypothetical protein ACK2UM_12740 [Anaerolineales bacterium]|jgi:hypothetical protein
MNKKLNYFLSAIPFILAMMLLFGMAVMPTKASPSEQKYVDNGNAQALKCAVNSLLMHKAQLWRLDFALSDGKGNALGLRDSRSSIGQDPCGIISRRLNFSWSDGRNVNPGSSSAMQEALEMRNEFNLQRLNFALTDGGAIKQGLVPETSRVIYKTSAYDQRRLEFGWTDGRGYNP